MQKIRETKKESKFTTYILVVSLVIFVATLFGQIFITNDIAVKGKSIVDLTQQRTSLEKEISVLKLESSKYASLKYIEDRAYELGFKKNNNYANLINATLTTASLNSF